MGRHVRFLKCIGTVGRCHWPGYSEPALPAVYREIARWNSERRVLFLCPRAYRRSILVRGGIVRPEMGPWSDGAAQGGGGGVVVAQSAAGQDGAMVTQSRPETRNLLGALLREALLSSLRWCATCLPFVVSKPRTTSRIDTGCRSARRPHPRSGFPTPFCSAPCCVPGPRWWLLLHRRHRSRSGSSRRWPRAFRSGCW